jgi:hypothetical protein
MAMADVATDRTTHQQVQMSVRRHCCNAYAIGGKMLAALIAISGVGIAVVVYAVWATIQLRAEVRDQTVAAVIAKMMVDSWNESYSLRAPVRDLTTNEARMKKRVMIDLETMAVTKDAAIIQLGAVVFHPTTPEYMGPLVECVGERFGVNITLESCLAAGLMTDESTTAWWERPEQIEAFRTTQEQSMPLREALIEFRKWCLADTDPENIEPWANGTSFDLAILETAYRKLGIPMPWRFFNERDYRTMKSLWRDVKRPEFDGVKHNATDDAVNQAVHMLAIIQHIDRLEMASRSKIDNTHLEGNHAI